MARQPTPRRRTRARRRGEVTIEEVARRSGVSVATVSRALRDLPNVAPSTKARVEEVAAELDYHPDRNAARLASGTNDTIGLAVPHIDTWYFSRVAAGVEAVLAEAGLDVVLQSLHLPPARQRLLESLGTARRLDGLILVDVSLSDAEARRLQALQSLDVVTVGQRTEHFPSVAVDNVLASEMATRHLINLGHRRIAFIGGNEDHPLAFTVPVARRVGYVSALEAAGIPVDEGLTAMGGYTIDGGSEAMAHLVAVAEPPTAVFCASDEMAFGATKTLTDLGLRVPDDISLVGFDDHELATVFHLTTVRQDPTWQGASAARLLVASREADETETHHVVGETRLVVRGTTAPPRRWS